MHKVRGPYKRAGRPKYIWIEWWESGRRHCKPFPANRSDLAQRFKALKFAQLNSDLKIFSAAERAIPWDTFEIEYIQRKKVDGLSEPSLYEIKNTLKEFKRITGIDNSGHISQGVVDRFILKRSELVKKPTLNKDIRNLKALFTWAVSAGFIADAPKIKQVRVAKIPRPPISNAQIKNLLIAAGKYKGWKERCLLALGSGLRREDIQSLTVDCFDLEHNAVHTKSQKTGKAQAYRPLPPDLVPIIVDYINSLPDGATSLWHDTHTGKKWEKIRTEAGLPDLKFHSLRKQFGSMLAQAGISTATITDLLELASEQTAKDIYINLPNETFKKAISTLPVKEWL